jgi:ribosome-associated toxin RatA of RatAB toxin-antitoxin module
MLCLAATSGAAVGAAVDAQPASTVTVEEAHGLYTVRARFRVAQPPDAARAVLTDYEGIPRFMPGVESSVVLERRPGFAVIEQRGLSRFMMFSKRVHLVLEVTQEAGRLRFRDRCGLSFSRYEGSWRYAPSEGGTEIVYELAAQPTFEVPEFILKRLLKRDSSQMIEALRREIADRRQVAVAAARR